MCYVVGSELDGKLVPREEILIRLLESERPRDATTAARLAIHVLEEHTPRVQEPLAPSFDDSKLTFLSADRDPASSTPRCMRYEVTIPQRRVQVTDVSDAMGKECAAQP